MPDDDDTIDPETEALVNAVADADGMVKIEELPMLIGLRMATMMEQTAAKRGLSLTPEQVVEACDLGAALGQYVLDTLDDDEKEP